MAVQTIINRLAKLESLAKDQSNPRLLECEQAIRDGLPLPYPDLVSPNVEAAFRLMCQQPKETQDEVYRELRRQCGHSD